MAKRGKRSREVCPEEFEEMKAKFHAMEEWKEGVEKKLRHLEQLEKCEGQYAKERRHDAEIEASTSRYLQLKFTSQPSSKIFTMTKVKGENSVDLVGLSVVDPLTEEVIPSGPESSMDVELVLVNAEFKGAETGNRKLEYFAGNIVTPRNGKPPLLMGDIILKLNGGSVVVGNLKITDNSSWVPSGRFILVARVTDGHFHGMRVKEAITNPFTVIEGRLKGRQKHHPPHPGDDVWRLEGISINGAYHQRLKEKGIYTVGDFLKSLREDKNGLRDDILKMTPSGWENTVSHAETCTPSEPIYQQFNPCISQATEVVQQQSVQAVYEQHEVVGVSSNVRINSLSRGSSDPGIQNGFCLNCLQFGGFHGAKSPAVAMSPFLNRFQEDHGHIIGSEDYEILEQGFDVEDLLQEPDVYVACAGHFLDVPTESTAGKHEAPLKWSTLIAAMAFSVRIVAVSGMQVETPHNT